MQTFNFILFNTVLHREVVILTTVIGIIADSAPSAVSVKQLCERSGIPKKEISKSCYALWRATLLQSNRRAGWTLVRQAGSITLEDVVRSAIAEKLIFFDAEEAAQVRPDRSKNGVSSGLDLIFMQAALAINHSVIKCLCGFPLSKLVSRAKKDEVRENFLDFEKDWPTGSDYCSEVPDDWRHEQAC